MSFVYPQLFSLERPPFTFALKYMPNTDLCGGTGGGGSGGTGQIPPCTDCPDKMPYTPQDVFDVQWPETISSVTIRLPNGSTLSSSGIATFSGQRLRINFCDAPPCFNVEINGECTFLAFERVSCFVDCATEPSPEDPNLIEPPPVQPQASFVQFEHVRSQSGVSFSTNIAGVSDAQYTYTQYPNTPISYLASSRNGSGGSATDHLQATVSGSIVTAQITTGVGLFLGWTFDVPSGSSVGYTQSGFYEPTPLPPVFLAGSPSNTFIEFIIPAGAQLRVRALFDV